PIGLTVHDLLIHPRDRELVIGTHGRGIYVVDIAPLELATVAALAEPFHLFDVKPATTFKVREPSTEAGTKAFRGTNPAFGAIIHYHLKDGVGKPAEIVVTDSAKKTVATLTGKKEAGLHQVV